MSTKYRPPEFTHGPRVARVQGIRRSGASGPHTDPRLRRVRTRGDARRAAIRASQREH